MPDDMYGESDDAAPTPPPGDKPPGPPKDKESAGKTAVLPVDVFPGGPPEPGDVCEFETVAVHGQEVEVRYMEHKEEEAPPAEAAMGGGGPPEGGGDMY